LVTNALDDVVIEPAMRLMKLELAKLDTIMTKLWPKCLKGNIAAQKVFLNYHRHRAILLGLYPRDGKTSVNVALINSAETTEANALEIAFVMPDGRKLAMDALDAEQISDGEYDARPQQRRPLPPAQIEHQHPFEADTIRPRLIFAFLLFCFGVTPGFVSSTLLLGKIDDTSGCVGVAIAALAAVVAEIDGKFRLDQIDRQNLAGALLRRVTVCRA
jgi:hypothetical protein